MNCKKCGQLIETEDKFCRKCGEKKLNNNKVAKIMNILNIVFFQCNFYSYNYIDYLLFGNVFDGDKLGWWFLNE